jgi:hypothetical protein
MTERVMKTLIYKRHQMKMKKRRIKASLRMTWVFLSDRLMEGTEIKGPIQEDLRKATGMLEDSGEMELEALMKVRTRPLTKLTRCPISTTK